LPRPSKRLSFGSIGLIAVIFCWGATPVLLKELTGSVDAWTANGVRYPMIALLYIPLVVWGFWRGELSGKIAIACIVPAICSLAGQGLWGMAPYYLEAQAMGFFARLSVVFSTIAAMLLFADERRLLAQPWFYLGCGLLVGGFIAFAYFGGYFQVALSATGVIIMVACAFCFGMYVVSVRYFLKSVSPLFSFAFVAQLVSIGTLTGMFIWGDYQVLGTIDQKAWAMLVGSAILGIALGHVFLYAAIARYGASIATAAQTATPFVTVFLAWLFIGEKMAMAQWPAGVAMVLGTIALMRSQQCLEKESRPTKKVEEVVDEKLTDKNQLTPAMEVD